MLRTKHDYNEKKALRNTFFFICAERSGV
jgi:hypothetical protein